MEAFIKSAKAENTKMDVLYAHNDDMALGAIQALEEAGIKPGKDILIISMDGIKDAFQAMKDGKINLIVECNPLMGPQLMQIAQDIVAGKEVQKRILTNEGVFPQDTAEKELPNRQY
ncbi:ABC transporter periplasmic-binding protein YtfQ precursor [compost metagenome]